MRSKQVVKIRSNVLSLGDWCEIIALQEELPPAQIKEERDVLPQVQVFKAKLPPAAIEMQQLPVEVHSPAAATTIVTKVASRKPPLMRRREKGKIAKTE